MSAQATDETYDYVIVGAGSAGCVLANRLTEGGATVLLLEAGKWDRDPLIHVPLGIGKIFPERLHDWGYFMQPDPAMGGRGMECARGKVVGGSSSINVMAYVRGHRSDFDGWAASGLRGWGYQDVLPYFRRMESWEGGADAFRGDAGPLRVQQTRYDDPILASFIAAGQQAGFAETTDYNGADQDGFGLIQETIHNGRRQSAATAFLRPALRRRTLRVVVEAAVSRVVLEAGRAVGVAYRQGGQSHTAQARREVILSAGTIDTPKLLMLSGIGDPAQLGHHGIATAVAAPGVGQNLQDHLSVLLTHRRKDRSTFERAMRYDRLGVSMARSWLGMGGFAGDVPIGVTGFVRTRPDLPAPDIQLLFLAAPFPARPYLPPFSKPVVDGYGCRVALLHPRSRGTVSLASADPAAAPLIAGGFLADSADLDALRDGIALTKRIMRQPAMARHDAGEAGPSAAADSPAEQEAFIRKASVTVHHPSSTCRMGAAGDLARVVDAELRVCGVDGLRVVDASAMPNVAGGNINAVVIMMAEKAADMILGRTALPAQPWIETVQRTRELT